MEKHDVSIRILSDTSSAQDTSATQDDQEASTKQSEAIAETLQTCVHDDVAESVRDENRNTALTMQKDEIAVSISALVDDPAASQTFESAIHEECSNNPANPLVKVLIQSKLPLPQQAYHLPAVTRSIGKGKMVRKW